jgi:hypothetical protein
VSAIAPSSVSPVLKSILTITITGYDKGTLDKSDLVVTLVKQTNSSIIRYMNVLEVDDDLSGTQTI